MPNVPPDAAVERFRSDLQTLIGDAPARIGLAVSGGPDSLALLLLAHAAGFQIEAATVDHGLRPEGSVEAAFVATLCRELGVPHAIFVLGAPDVGNLSDWARAARYAALEAWIDQRGLDHLLTAHHADDQLETMIMRLNRGSGVAGLAGIRARRGQIARPLLGWRKLELEALVADCGVTAMHDATNWDDRFDRARLRKQLASADWLDPVSAAGSAAALADAETALAWTAQAFAMQRIAANAGIVTFDPQDLPRELLRRLTLMCLRQINPDANPRGDALDRLLSALDREQTVTLADVKCVGRTHWTFVKAPARS